MSWTQTLRCLGEKPNQQMGPTILEFQMTICTEVVNCVILDALFNSSWYLNCMVEDWEDISANRRPSHNWKATTSSCN